MITQCDATNRTNVRIAATLATIAVFPWIWGIRRPRPRCDGRQSVVVLPLPPSLLCPSVVLPGRLVASGAVAPRSLVTTTGEKISEEDMCLMGNVRVNLAKLQKVAANRRRVVIIARYVHMTFCHASDTRISCG